MKTTGSIKIGQGTLQWDRGERVGNRYGCFYLTDQQESKIEPKFSAKAAQSLEGKRVKLTAEVKEARDSNHIGDIFLGIGPSTPNVGDSIDIGVGTFILEKNSEGKPAMGLKPSDGRSELWIDPRILYRLHMQTVEVFAQETNEPDSPVFGE